MTTTTTTVRPRGSRRISLAWIAPALLAVVVAVMIVSLSRAMPDRESITVDNRTGAPVTVNATGAGDDSWLGLGTVDPRSRDTVESVVDQGRVWRFRLTVGPDRIGEIRRTEDQLRSAGWTLTIPAGAADALPAARRS